MAIDTTMFAAQIPAGTYAIGDRIPLAVIRGPKVVRDGYGGANLKRVFTTCNVTPTAWVVHVKNSNWVDDMSNPAVGPSDSFLSNESGAIQQGQDIPLVPNSGWEVYAECIVAGTTTADADIIALIDVDYPRVAAVQNPRNVQGFPVTIEQKPSVTVTATGSVAAGAVWNTYNVDIFKAGAKYLLTEGSFLAGGSGLGFMSVSGAAGQAGLERIIPCRSGSTTGIRFKLDYSTPLVKGPMNINYMAVGTAATVTAYAYMDYVKKAL